MIPGLLLSTTSRERPAAKAWGTAPGGQEGSVRPSPAANLHDYWTPLLTYRLLETMIASEGHWLISSAIKK